MATVLVVENDVPAMRLMAWGLMEAGFEVAVAHVPEASEHLLNRRPDFVVFNTLKRTEEKAQLVARFRELSPTSRIVDVAAASVGETRSTGADAHLTVPIQIAELVQTLNRLTD
jgi:DNA-binding response OmpR family regulator